MQKIIKRFEIAYAAYRASIVDAKAAKVAKTVAYADFCAANHKASSTAYADYRAAKDAYDKAIDAYYAAQNELWNATYDAACDTKKNK